ALLLATSVNWRYPRGPGAGVGPDIWLAQLGITAPGAPDAPPVRHVVPCTEKLGSATVAPWKVSLRSSVPPPVCASAIDTRSATTMAAMIVPGTPLRTLRETDPTPAGPTNTSTRQGTRGLRGQFTASQRCLPWNEPRRRA